MQLDHGLRPEAAASDDRCPQTDAGADSSNRPWETDSLRIGAGRDDLAWGWLAIAAAALLSLADVALLYSPRGDYGSAELELLAGLPRWRLLLGHYLGLLAMPLYIPGYWLLYRGLRAAGGWWSLPVFLLGAYAAAIGCGLHAAIALSAALAGGEAAGATIAALSPFVRPLQGIVLGLVALASIWMALAIGSGRGRFPRWLAAATPFALALLFTVPYLVAPGFQPARLMLPAALNLGHLVFFALVVATLRPAADP